MAKKTSVEKIVQAYRKLGISKQTHYRRTKGYGALKLG